MPELGDGDEPVSEGEVAPPGADGEDERVQALTSRVREQVLATTGTRSRRGRNVALVVAGMIVMLLVTVGLANWFLGEMGRGIGEGLGGLGDSLEALGEGFSGLDCLGEALSPEGCASASAPVATLGTWSLDHDVLCLDVEVQSPEVLSPEQWHRLPNVAPASPVGTIPASARSARLQDARTPTEGTICFDGVALEPSGLVKVQWTPGSGGARSWVLSGASTGTGSAPGTTEGN